MKDKCIDKAFIVILFILYSICLYANNQNNDTTYVFNKKYEGKIWGKNYPLNIKDNKNFRWNPRKEDIDQAELLLHSYILKQWKNNRNVNQTGNCPIIYLNMNQYLRQYIGRINKKGERILEINCFWKGNVEKFPNWHTHLVSVIDGCSFYWSIKVNLSKKKCFDYWIDGE